MTITSKHGRRGRAALMAGAALVLFSSATVPMLSPALAGSAPLTTEVAGLTSYADLVALAKPAVVTVQVAGSVQPARAARQDGPVPMIPFGGQGQTPYDEFFRQFFGQGQDGPWKMLPAPGQPAPGMPGEGRQVMRGLGSGFIVSADGVIVTNNHVVDGASTIRVTLDDGSEHDATLLGRDPKTDVAVLKIDAGENLPFLEWGDSANLRVGDPIVAIGNPFGVGTTVTSGIVSARGRDLHNGPYDDFIQVDAAINHGNSGGPLLDATGHVVGVNAAIYSPNDGNVGVGFAIPSDLAQSIVAELVNDGKIERGYLGVQIQPVTPDLAEAIGLDEAKGALVAHVEDGTPAAKAGVKSGDVIVGLGGKDVADAKSLSRQVAGIDPDSTETLTLIRDGKKIELGVTIARLPGDDEVVAASANADGTSDLPDLGLSVLPISPEVRDQYGLGEDVKGLLVTDVADKGGAADVGIRPGDVIVAVNMRPVTTAGEAKEAIGEALAAHRGAILLRMARDGNESFIGVPVQAS